MDDDTQDQLLRPIDVRSRRAFVTAVALGALISSLLVVYVSVTADERRNGAPPREFWPHHVLRYADTPSIRYVKLNGGGDRVPQPLIDRLRREDSLIDRIDDRAAVQRWYRAGWPLRFYWQHSGEDRSGATVVLRRSISPHRFMIVTLFWACAVYGVMLLLAAVEAGARAAPAAIARALNAAKARRRSAHVPCVRCGYELAGLPSPVCPECGTAHAEPLRPPLSPR